MFNLTFDIYLLTSHIYHLTLSMTFGIQALDSIRFLFYFASKSLTIELDWVSQSVGLSFELANLRKQIFAQEIEESNLNGKIIQPTTSCIIFTNC